VLTHLPPGADRARARALAEGPFGGEVDLPQGRSFEIGSTVRHAVVAFVRGRSVMQALDRFA
jgi:hypothetical protein